MTGLDNPFASTRFVPADAKRMLVVLSDIEMGAGGRVDGFPQSDFLAAFIRSFNQAPYSHLDVDLVFNGDTFDMLRTSYLDQYPRHINREVAMGKLARIVSAHPLFFEAVRVFLEHPHGARRVYFIVGNHDAELVSPHIQQYLRMLCGGDERVIFPGFALDFPGIHIEHGSQLDPLFRVNPEAPIIEHEGQKLLNISWGAAALLDAVMQWQPIFAFHERVKPRDKVFELIPELKTLLTETYWHYWTHDYWRGFFGSKDPTKKLSWSMAKELVSRFASRDTDVSVDNVLVEQIRNDDAPLLSVLGHMHEARIWTYADRKVIQAGCFAYEYALLDDEGRQFRHIPVSYVEAFVDDNAQLICSNLVEIPPPPSPPGYVPESLLSVLPQIQDLLATLKPPKEAEAERQAQEHKEKKEQAKVQRSEKAASAAK